MRDQRSKGRKRVLGSKSVVGVLRHEAARLRSLKEEADTAIYGEGNIPKYRRKLEARAGILIKLPRKLRREFRGVNDQSLRNVMLRIEGFASDAREALASEGVFLLAILLTHRGDKVGDKNDLEKLIDSL